MSDNKEREAFEAWREECGYNTEAFKGVLKLAWRAALAHAEPVYDQSVVRRLATQMGWTPPSASPAALSDGAIREIVNQLRDIAVEFHATQQLRARIAHVIVPRLKSVAAAPAVLTVPDGYAIKRVEGHGWIIDPPSGSRWIAHEGTPAGDFMAALLAAQPAAERCEYCDGTGDVHDATGEWRGECNCGAAEPARADRQECEHDWIENKGYPLSDTAAEVCSKCWIGRDEPALSPRAESVARALLADRQGVALSDERLEVILAGLEDQGFDTLRRADKEDLLAFADLFLDRASSSRAEVEIPKGYVLAPRASTDKMNAAGKAAAKGFHHSHADYIDAIYEAMLAAVEGKHNES